MDHQRHARSEHLSDRTRKSRKAQKSKIAKRRRHRRPKEIQTLLYEENHYWGLCLTTKNCFYIMNYKFERKFMKNNEISEDHVNPQLHYITL